MLGGGTFLNGELYSLPLVCTQVSSFPLSDAGLLRCLNAIRHNSSLRTLVLISLLTHVTEGASVFFSVFSSQLVFFGNLPLIA